MSHYVSGELKVGDSEFFSEFVKVFDYYIEFFKDLSNLIYFNGRIITFKSEKKCFLLDTCLIRSSVQTLLSIKLCSSIGSLADANILLRKFRDDLLQYVFILDVISERKVFVENDFGDFDVTDAEKFVASLEKLRFNPNFSQDERAVLAWFDNSIHMLPLQTRLKLSFDNYMRRLKLNENISEVLKNYGLDEYWTKLQNRLNNYVHNNGERFSRKNFVFAHDLEKENMLLDILNQTSYISSFFLVLLLMTDASLISSNDLVTYLDCGVEPPEGCQYSVAPFIQDFINLKVVKVHPELKRYLQDNNNCRMNIE